MRPATEAALVSLTATIAAGRIELRQKDQTLSVRDWIKLQRRLETAQEMARTGRLKH